MAQGRQVLQGECFERFQDDRIKVVPQPCVSLTQCGTREVNVRSKVLQEYLLLNHLNVMLHLADKERLIVRLIMVIFTCRLVEALSH